MKNKGFTLIELLGSIIILGLIALIALPATLNFLGSSEKNIDEAKKSVIVRAAKDYVTDNPNEFKRDSSLNNIVLTNDLIDKGYITNKDIIENEELSRSCTIVTVNESNKYKFEFKNKDEC